MGITASVIINDDESGLHHDYQEWLEKAAPHVPIDQAGPGAVGTTVLVRTPVLDEGQRLAVGKLGRRAPEAGSRNRPHVQVTGRDAQR